MPNITGTFNGGADSNGNPNTGPFYLKSHSERTGAGYANTQAQDRVGGFDASRSSTIYGNSGTVTPLSQSTLYILKY